MATCLNSKFLIDIYTKQQVSCNKKHFTAITLTFFREEKEQQTLFSN